LFMHISCASSIPIVASLSSDTNTKPTFLQLTENHVREVEYDITDMLTYELLISGSVKHSEERSH
jgi:hypothetical protein